MDGHVTARVRKRARVRVFAALGALLLVFAVGCGSDDKASGGGSSDGPIKVGTSLPLTSPLSAEAESLRSGYEMAVEDINAKGGVEGRKIELTVGDDKADAALAKQIAQKQIGQDGVNAILGSYGSAASMTQSAEAGRNAVPGVYPFASVEEMVTRGLKTVFNLYPLSAQAEAATDGFLLANVKPKKVAIIFVDNPFAISGAEASRKTLEKAGVKVPVFEKVALDSQLIGPVSKAKQAGVDVIKAIGYNANYAAYIQALDQTGLNVKAATFETQIPFEKRSIEQVGAKKANLILGNPYWVAGMTPEFEGRYKKRYNEAPEFQAVLGYAAVEVLADAIRRAGTAEGDKLVEALGKTDMDTVVGRVTFDERGQYNEPLTVAQLQDGKVVGLWPSEEAEGKLSAWQPVSSR